MSIPVHILPARYQDQVAAQLGTPKKAEALFTKPAKPMLKQDRTGLNKTETAFLAYLKENFTDASTHITAQGLTLKLANGVRYTPDFIVVYGKGEITAYETKGFMRDDAGVKIKVAAQQWPWITFYLVTRRKKEWQIEKVFS